jgi:hypothetical protein
MSKVYDWKPNGGGLPLLPTFAPVPENIYFDTLRETYGAVGSYFMTQHDSGSVYKCRVVRMIMEQGGLQVGEKLWYQGIGDVVQGNAHSVDYDPGTDPYTWAGYGLYPMNEEVNGWILCIATP